MKKKYNLLFIYVVLIIEIFILINSKIIINNVVSTSKLFIYNIFPSMIPTMISGNLLIKQGIDKIIPNWINKIFDKLFNFNNIHTSLFIMSIFCGTPSNAIYINEYLEKGIINDIEAESLLCCTHFINPLFVIGGIGINVFNNIKIGFLLFFVLLIENIIKAYILRNKFKNNNFNTNINTNESIINFLIKSTKTSLDSSIVIFGMVIVFNILICIINTTIPISVWLKTIINGILEVTTGTLNINYLNINIIFKFLITYFFINYGGLCIHMQTISMIKNKKIRYLKYLIFRII